MKQHSGFIVALVRASLVALLFAAGIVDPAQAQPRPAAPEAKPQRVASLNLASDEVLVEILPLSRLVAVTALIDEVGTSNAIGKVPKSIARFPKVDVERLIALKPDLIVVSEYTDADVLRALQNSDLKAHRMIGLDSFEGFKKALLDLGSAVGERTAAEGLVKNFDARLAAIDAAIQGAPRPKVLYWASSFTSGAKTPFDAIIRCGGGENTAALAGMTGITTIGAERAFGLDPDWLLIGQRTATATEIRSHPLLSKMRAVKAGHVVEMPTDILVALNHHAAKACEFMARTIHKDRFAK
jgi:iron complex transport system substrate-binding protein